MQKMQKVLDRYKTISDRKTATRDFQQQQLEKCLDLKRQEEQVVGVGNGIITCKTEKEALDRANIEAQEAYDRWIDLKSHIYDVFDD